MQPGPPLRENIGQCLWIVFPTRTHSLQVSLKDEQRELKAGSRLFWNKRSKITFSQQVHFLSLLVGKKYREQNSQLRQKLSREFEGGKHYQKWANVINPPPSQDCKSGRKTHTHTQTHHCNKWSSTSYVNMPSTKLSSVWLIHGALTSLLTVKHLGSDYVVSEM